MPDPGAFTLADALTSFNSVLVILILGAVFLVLWQVAILLGALIANLLHSRHGEDQEQSATG